MSDETPAKPPPDTSWLQTAEVHEGDRRPASAPPPVLVPVRARIAELGPLAGVRAPLAALVEWNAFALENCRPDAPEAAKARLAQELRATMVALTTVRTDDHDRLDQFLDEMGTPADLSPEVGDATDAKPADTRAKGRRNRQGPR